MSLDWEVLKSVLGSSSRTFIFYVNNEGDKILINSDCEFQKALKISSMGQKYLKLLIYDDCMNHCKSIFVHFYDLGQLTEKENHSACGVIQMRNKGKPITFDTMHKECLVKHTEVEAHQLKGAKQFTDQSVKDLEHSFRITPTDTIRCSEPEVSQLHGAGQHKDYNRISGNLKHFFRTCACNTIKCSEAIQLDLTGQPKDHNKFPPDDRGKKPTNERVQTSCSGNSKHPFSVCACPVIRSSEPEGSGLNGTGQPETVTLCTCSTEKSGQYVSLCSVNSVKCSEPVIFQTKDIAQPVGHDGYLSSDKGRKSGVITVNLNGNEQKENRAVREKTLKTVTDNTEKDKECKNIKIVKKTDASQNQTVPDWFSQYMKKFKKEIVYELKSDMHVIIHSAIKKLKSEIDSALRKKMEVPDSPASFQKKKKKKKKSPKTVVKIKEQKSEKLPKQLKQLKSTKSECVKEPDSKTKVLLEKGGKLLEEQRKSKLQKSSSLTFEKKNLSASFGKESTHLFLPPDSEFSVFIKVINDGKAQWFKPRLECFHAKGITPKEATISLPKLRPNESCFATVKGKTPNDLGLYCLKFRFVDHLEKLNQEFTCWVKVENTKSTKKLLGNLKNVFVNSEGDFFSSSEKIIEENINEIEKRLHDIDLLRPVLPEQKKNKTTKKKNKKTEEFKGLKLEEKTTVEKLEEEAMQFGLDYLIFADQLEEDNAKAKKRKNEEESHKEEEEKLESDCDSMLSVISMTNDEYLIVESLSDTESGSEGEKLPSNKEKDKTSTSNEEQEDSLLKKKQPIKVEIRTRPQDVPFAVGEEPMKSSTRSRPSPFGEEISKAEKMKSKSTEYSFTTANLVQPTFTQVSNLTSERKFTFTREKEEKSSEAEEVFEKKPSKFTCTAEKKGKPKMEDREKWNIRETDSSGQVIYAVNSRGLCLPAKDLFERGENWKNLSGKDRATNSRKKEESKAHHEVQSERPNNTQPVKILPNILVNGASNVTSLAFNTVKSGLNNLQSAFVTEKKTKKGQSACETKIEVDFERMRRFYENMRLDFQINSQSLQRNNE